MIRPGGPRHPPSPGPAPGVSYLGSRTSPSAGSCARAPHGDSAGREGRQVSDGQSSLPALPCHSRPAHTHPRAARRTAALRGAAGSPCGWQRGPAELRYLRPELIPPWGGAENPGVYRPPAPGPAPAPGPDTAPRP